MVAKLTTPDLTRYLIPGYNSDATFGDYLAVLYRNSLVLALHAMACVAGFMAGSSLPLSASKRSGISRWVHEKAGPLAIGFVVCATTFSLCTQAYVIGGGAATIAAQLGTTPGMLLLALAPHALPELFALFLPLAAWIVASRAGQWQDLLAATFVTVAIAVPILLGAAAIEIWVSPRAAARRSRLLNDSGATRRPPRWTLLRLGRCQQALSLVTGDFCPVSETNVT